MVEDRRLNETYGALTSPVRRDILTRLRRGEARVTELAEPFDISLAAISKHVRVLEEAGLVRREVVGREHRLAISPLPLMAASSWLEGYRQFWEGRVDTLESLLRRRDRR